MKKKDAVRIIAVCLAAVIITAGFAIKTEIENQKYKLALQNTYSRSLDELNTSVNNISNVLQKAQYVSSPNQISSLAAKLLTEAELSKTVLSQLPLGNELTQLNRFLSQVGNYALSVSKTLISGNELSELQAENIKKLSDTAQKISSIISDSQISFNNSDYWAKELENKIDSNIDSESLANSLGELEESLSDYPKLIYDGPFSDHILEKEPALLKNAEAISREEGKKIALKAVNQEKNSTNLRFEEESSGNIPSYRYVADGITVSISRAGGQILYMRRERNIEETILTHEQAMEKAKRYLEQLNLSNFTETYFFTNEGICTINFAYTDGKTICYTDLLKVGVAMDNGEIMFFEASGYISNHTERTFTTPTHTLEEAAAVINPELTITKTALSLIPTSGKNEVRCYEFTCTTKDGHEILIYINTDTLEEEEILILLKTDGGTLVK